jgi:predicted DNA-binding protein with PD1-like motif
MKYKMIDEHTYVILLAPGEEIVEKLSTFLEQEGIVNAHFSGIGALKMAELAHYRVDTGKYSSRAFEEPLELANLSGNAFLFEGKPLVHAHATLADANFTAIAGHLVSGIISSTAEILVKKLDSKLQKKYSPAIGLKLLNI